MSLLTLMQSDAASLVINTSDAGQSVTHRPLNVAASDASVTAVWHEDEPIESNERGVGILRRGTLTVGSSVTVTTRDRWQVNSEWWETTRWQTDGGGLQVVYVQQPRDEIRSGTRSATAV